MKMCCNHLVFAKKFGCKRNSCICYINKANNLTTYNKYKQWKIGAKMVKNSENHKIFSKSKNFGLTTLNHSIFHHIYFYDGLPNINLRFHNWGCLPSTFHAKIWWRWKAMKLLLQILSFQAVLIAVFGRFLN